MAMSMANRSAMASIRVPVTVRGIVCVEFRPDTPRLPASASHHEWVGRGIWPQIVKDRAQVLGKGLLDLWGHIARDGNRSLGLIEHQAASRFGNPIATKFASNKFAKVSSVQADSVERDERSLKLNIMTLRMILSSRFVKQSVHDAEQNRAFNLGFIYESSQLIEDEQAVCILALLNGLSQPFSRSEPANDREAHNGAGKESPSSA
jgi:hypothetical protein